MNSEILRRRIAEAVHRHHRFLCQPDCPGPSVHDYDEADAVMADAGVDPFETKAAIAVLDNIALDGRDPEGAHVRADGVLLAYAPDDIKQAYERVRARVGGFHYA